VIFGQLRASPLHKRKNLEIKKKGKEEEKKPEEKEPKPPSCDFLIDLCAASSFYD
jgi:hypothetical protein